VQFGAAVAVFAMVPAWGATPQGKPSAPEADAVEASDMPKSFIE